MRKDNYDPWWSDDICWCADSDTCDQTNCFRHLTNKDDRTTYYSAASMKWTVYCPMEKKEKKNNEKSTH